MRFCKKRWSVLWRVWSLVCANVCCASFYAHRYEGFHGYECGRVAPCHKEETTRVARVMLEHALDAAYAHPTFDHVKRYLTLQKRHMRKSEAFARMWERVLWVCPQLDERARIPVAQGARKIHQEAERVQDELFMRRCAQDYGLLVCVRERNTFFSEVIKQFCLEYGWSVRVIAPHSVEEGVCVDPEGVEALGVDVFPFVFVVHKKKHIVVRCGAGFLSLEEVIYRVKSALRDVVKTEAVRCSDAF